MQTNNASDVKEDDLEYHPDSEDLEKLYPKTEISDMLVHGFVKEDSIKLPSIRPYISFVNRNRGIKEDEDLRPVPGIEIGVRGIF